MFLKAAWQRFQGVICRFTPIDYPLCPCQLTTISRGGEQRDVLAALKCVLRGVHGEEEVEQEVSNSSLANEIQSVFVRMMVATPPTTGKAFRR
jgi:hypothetical protein